MGIAEGVTAITTSLGIAKEVMNAKHAYSQAELQLKIVGMVSELMKAQEVLSEAKTNAAEKDIEIKRLKEFSEKREALIEHRGLLYRKSDGGVPIGRPHCPVCIQMSQMYFEVVGDGINKHCPSCKARYPNGMVFIDHAANLEEKLIDQIGREERGY